MIGGSTRPRRETREDGRGLGPRAHAGPVASGDAAEPGRGDPYDADHMRSAAFDGMVSINRSSDGDTG
jgi:hypothetical protein